MEQEGPAGSQGERPTATTARAAEPGPWVPPFGHAAFSGDVPARLEPTGRLAIPAVFRSAFGGPARMRPFRDEYLMLWTEQSFDIVATDLCSRAGLLDPQARKRLYRTTQSVTVDRQGRVVIPPALRERVGLVDEVIVAGSIDCLEIYSADGFDRPRFEGDSDLAFATYDGPPTTPTDRA